MTKYKTRFGVGGGINDIDEGDAYEYPSKEAAVNEAFAMACEVYEKYEGYYGLRTVNQIIDQDGVELEEAEALYEEERESWLVYDAEEAE